MINKITQQKQQQTDQNMQELLYNTKRYDPYIGIPKEKKEQGQKV